MFFYRDANSLTRGFIFSLVFLIYTGTIGLFLPLSELATSAAHLVLPILSYRMLFDGNTLFRSNAVFILQHENCRSVLPICDVECPFHGIHLHPAAPPQEAV